MRLPTPAPESIVAFSVLPFPLLSEVVASSVLPEPVPSDVVAFSVLPEPVPGEVVRFSVLPTPVPSDVVRFSVLPAPVSSEVVRVPGLPSRVPSKVAGSSVLPSRAPSKVAESSVFPWRVPAKVVRVPVLLPAPTPPAIDVRIESSPAVAPGVALAPSRERSSPPAPGPPAPRPPTKRAPAAPSRPRRFRVGLVAVVLGALGVVAVREFVGNGDEEGAPTAVEPSGAATETSIDGDAAPAGGQTAAPATTVASSVSPAVSAQAPIDPAAAAPETTTPLVPTPPTNTAPAAGVTQFSGFGNFVIDFTGHDLSRKFMVVTHNGVAGFELSTLDQNFIQIALVESVVGSLTGTYPLGFDGDVMPSYLRIDADGDWTIEIKPVEEARLWQADFISGTGADVLRFEGGASVLEYTNAGSSNFIVQYHRNPGFDLLVNEIGPISGTTTMQAGPGVVVVDAVGDWALSARPT